MTESEIVKRADDAKRLLDSELLQEVLSKLDETYVQAWRNGKTLEAREDAYRYVQLTKQFKADIEALVKEGQFAADRIKRLEGRRFFG